jgi:Asp-tRNA(Asn)/Glu-tRNA(Gln) amidotransferase A subunit family amidase
MSQATKPRSAQGRSRSDPADLGVLEAGRLLRAGHISSIELTQAFLRRIEERNGGAPTHDGAPDAINAWIRLYPEEHELGIPRDPMREAAQ